MFGLPLSSLCGILFGVARFRLPLSAGNQARPLRRGVSERGTESVRYRNHCTWGGEEGGLLFSPRHSVADSTASPPEATEQHPNPKTAARSALRQTCEGSPPGSLPKISKWDFRRGRLIRGVPLAASRAGTAPAAGGAGGTPRTQCALHSILKKQFPRQIFFCFVLL